MYAKFVSQVSGQGIMSSELASHLCGQLAAKPSLLVDGSEFKQLCIGLSGKLATLFFCIGLLRIGLRAD